MHEADLLHRFVDEDAQDAFAELVQGKINLVYATALRLVGGDAHLAEDVTQAVFLALACNARQLRHHPALTSWLYTTTRFVASKALRTQRRWQQRELRANTMSTESDRHAIAWEELRPVIDEALQELRDEDRTVLLLRFFENRSHAAIGAVLGLGENAARMRVDRALEKLRLRLKGRGVTSTTTALGVALSSQPLIAAPAGLAVQTISTALAGLAAAPLAATALGPVSALAFMTTGKFLAGTAAALFVFGAGAFVGGRVTHASATADAKSETARATSDSTRVTEENRRLAADLREARSALSAATAATPGAALPPDATAITGKWKLLAQLQKDKLINAGITVIGRDGELNPSVVSLFDVTPTEQAALKALTASVREKIQALEQANATVTRPNGNEIVIAVKPFPDAGGAVYDELMKGFAETLGPDRNAAFITLGADQVERSMASFGATERTITLKKQPDSEHSRYLGADLQVAPGSRSSSSGNYRTRDDLAARIGTISKLIPPDF